jgi:site-specific recombinase XerD
MTIDELLTHYLGFRRTLGEKCQSNESVLRAFSRAVGPQTSVAQIGAEHVALFLNGHDSITSVWFKKYQTLKGFFHFALSRGHVKEVPLPKVLPKRPPPFAPYIYTRDEIGRLLGAIPSLHRRSLIAPDTLRAILLLLYGAGLRVGEALALSVKDIDLPNALITVRDTKFFKSRLVPIGSALADVLTEYARWRAASYPEISPGSPFFVSRRGIAVLRSTMEETFVRLRDRAGIRRQDDARYQPRLHDLRHSFAVHRLIQWYQQRADVQRLVYDLSVYLGHAHLRHTQVYLSMTSDLLQQAGARFEQYIRGEGNHA